MNSALITPEERSELQRRVGTQQTIVALGVAKLHLASPDAKAQRKNDPKSILRTFRNLTSESWTDTNVVGALVFLIDRSCDAFIFQIYNLQTFQLRFEYELYVDCEYTMLSPNFHAFEMEDCVAGFNFASKDEARSVLSKVMALKPSSKSTGANLLKSDKKKGFFGGFFGGSSKNVGKRDSLFDVNVKISSVRMVRHDNHVGLKADGTFDVDALPSHWKDLFKQAGVRKKDLTNPETAGVIYKTIVEQGRKEELVEQYRQDADYQDMDEDELEDAVDELDEEELAAYRRYEEELADYYRELEAYEAEQQALEQWEADNAEIAASPGPGSEAGESFSERALGSDSKVPPALPPRKQVKQLEAEAKQVTKVADRRDKELSKAVKVYRQSLVRIQKNPEQEAFEKAAEDARRAAEEAKQAAEAAAEERDEIMREIDEMRSQLGAAKKRVSLSVGPGLGARARGRSSTTQGGSAAPPVPSSAPPQAAPPPPPPLPQLPPAPPQMPELPALPKKPTHPAGALPGSALQAGIAKAKLRKNNDVKDRSKPMVKAPPKTGFLGAIEKGVPLARSPTQQRASKLPNIVKMKPKAQNALMAKLIETMNERRTLMNEEDSDDEWSD